MTYSELHILVVDDNPGDQFLINELLQETSLHIPAIETAYNIQEAITVLQTKRVDLVLLDLSLPDSSGIDSFLSVNRFAATIPVVILSGLNDTKTATDAISLGAQDFLMKGEFNEKLLEKTILYSIERKKTLQELRLSNERYELVSKATNDMVWDWDIVNDIIYRNEEQFVKILRLPASDKDRGGEFWTSRLHPDDTYVLDKIIWELEKDKQKNQFEETYRFLDGGGEYIYVMDKGYAVRNEEGKVIRIIGALRDITERKKAEEELLKLSLVARETDNAVIITDTDIKIQWVNEAFERSTGYSLEEVVGKNPGSLLQGPDTDKTKNRYIRQQIESSEPFSCEILNYTRDGRPYWVLLEGQPVLDSNGKLLYFFALQTDITERKKAEEFLRQSEEKYRNFFNSIPASIFIWRLSDFKIMEINDVAAVTYGYTKDELLKLTTLDLRPTQDYKRVKDFVKEALADESFTANRVWRHVSKTGEELFMQISSTRIDYKGDPSIMAISINVTDKIKLEKILEEEKEKKELEITRAVISAQEKEREEIGRELHDNVNQILASSRLYLGLVKDQGVNYKSYIEESDLLINSAIREIRQLSHSLIPPAMQDADLERSINTLINIVQEGSGIIIQKNVSDVDTLNMSDQLKLTIYRILQEQMNNVLKYSKAEKVEIRLQKEKGKLCLRVIDDGVGFDASVKTEGVGLLNIRTRASLVNGTVNIETAPGKGCDLIVCFSQ